MREGTNEKAKKASDLKKLSAGTILQLGRNLGSTSSLGKWVATVGA